MNRNSQGTIQKWLLIFTCLAVVAFLFTFPTRDRRGTIDRIRLKVGADHLVSKRTLKEIAAEDRAAGRAPKRPNVKLDPKLIARGHNSAADVRQRMVENVSFYCNKQYERNQCGQWLNTCGESCRVLVQPELWASLTSQPAKPASTRTIAATKSKAR